MSHIRLRCVRCASAHDADMDALRCSECGSPLEVEYTEATAVPPGPQPPDWSGPGIPLPLHQADAMVSMGEGNTPCARLAALGRQLGLAELYAKLEFLNPTGSFKDRGTAIMMSVAKELGVIEMVEDSSGNAGASVAAYAARAGIKAHIFAPAGAPPAKIQQIKVYGGEAHLVEGSREATATAAVEYCSRRGLVYASHNLSPYFLEGTKTFAYDVARQFARRLPDHIVMPVGNGSLLIGAWKGFHELLRAGRISRMPRLHCVQARTVMPIAAAFGGEKWTPKAGSTSIAGGISVEAPPRKDQTLMVLAETGGVAVAVDDGEILRWQKALAEKEGLYAEPTSAAAFAGLDRLVGMGEIKSADLTLVPVTGFGLKDAPPQ